MNNRCPKNSLAERDTFANLPPLSEEDPFCKRIADEQIAKSHASKGMSAHDRVMRLGKACGQVCENVLATKDEILRDCYYDTYNRPIYKPKFKNGDPQQINVKVGGEFLDIAAISPLVASAASFNIHRIYYDGSIERQGAELDARLRCALEDVLN